MMRDAAVPDPVVGDRGTSDPETPDLPPPRRAVRTARSGGQHRGVVLCGIVVGAVVAVLWGVQLPTLSLPCDAPGCVWPRLSSRGFAAVAELGLPPTAWVAFAAAMSAVSIVVPFALAIVVARSAEVPAALPMLWFAFALGPVSSGQFGLLGSVLRLLALTSWFLLFALFPNARFRPGWVVVAPIGAAAWTIVLMLPPIAEREAASDPLWWALEAIGYILCVGVIVAAQIVQFRAGGGRSRRQLGLLLVVFVLFLAFAVVNAVLMLLLGIEATGYGTLRGALMYELSELVTLLMLGVVAVAMVRDGAYGARIVVDRALVTAIALLIAVIVYATVAATASATVSGWLPAALAGTITAVALAGVYARIGRVIGRLVYGDADDPAAIAAALDSRVAAVDDPSQLLPVIGETLAERLRFPAVRFVGIDEPGSGTGSTVDRAAGGKAVAETPWMGAVDANRRIGSVSLTLDDRPLGSVEVVMRPGQRRLTTRDRSALAAASGPLAAALTARRLTAELRRSRRDALVGRDDERRALRRRLHDDVGPTLALAGHLVEAARTEPEKWTDVRQTIDDALAQVRAISRELRPPALDDLGLGPALESFASGIGVALTVSAPAERLPGIIEIAIHRIAVEALVNAVRHGGARSCELHLSRDRGVYELVIIDDGSGIAPGAVIGVGLLSMRERAEELGGVLTVTCRCDGPNPSAPGADAPVRGTEVRARIPAGEEAS